MKTRSSAIFAGLIVGVAMPCSAQQAESEVRRAIQEAVQGRCSDVLSTMLKYTCEQQMPQAASTYKALGQLQGLAFRGYEATPAGQAEVYLATHAHGKMMWAAIKASDGKLTTLWSPGPTR